MQWKPRKLEEKKREIQNLFQKPQTQIYRVTDKYKLCIRRHNYIGWVTVILTKHRKKSSNERRKKKSNTHTHTYFIRFSSIFGISVEMINFG